MKEVVIVSGKGGTGKTSLTAAFAELSGRKVICDTDVDASNMPLILNPSVVQKNEFTGGFKALKTVEECCECGACRNLCRFRAIDENFNIKPELCEGCGVCVSLCPEGVIMMKPTVAGEWFISETRSGPMVHARLGVAEENSGKLVAQVRKIGREIAQQSNMDLILVDGPPGIGCPAISAITGCSLVVMVAEPTVSSIHDVKRLYELTCQFNIPAVLCVNKCDIDPARADEIESFAEEAGIPIVGRIPFDQQITQSLVQGQTIINHAPESNTSQQVRLTWQNIYQRLNNACTEVCQTANCC